MDPATPATPPVVPGPWSRAAAGAGLLEDGTARATVFARMSARAAQLGAANLGQGFPDTDPPEIVAEAAVAAIRAGCNQYPPGPGELELREAIARHQRERYGLDWDPAAEVLVTTGATEALAATLLALVSPGEEVLTLEPFYDQYGAMIALAGGVHRTVGVQVRTGEDGELHLGVDPEAIRAAIGPSTRAVLLNTPHNPTGIVLEESILQVIAEEAARHDALIITDEVYEHLTYGAPHRPIAALEQARERTVSISSAGKTFSVTGWKIGWVTARPDLIMAITAVKQWLTFTSGAPFQGAVAAGLSMPPGEIAQIGEDLRERRDLLAEGLRSVGLRICLPEAGYFIVADVSGLQAGTAEELCERWPEEAGVVAIPLSAFYREGAAERQGAQHLVRFAFCKDRPTIRRAVAQLQQWARRA